MGRRVSRLEREDYPSATWPYPQGGLGPRLGGGRPLVWPRGQAPPNPSTGNHVQRVRWLPLSAHLPAFMTTWAGVTDRLTDGIEASGTLPRVPGGVRLAPSHRSWWEILASRHNRGRHVCLNIIKADIAASRCKWGSLTGGSFTVSRLWPPNTTTTSSVNTDPEVFAPWRPLTGMSPVSGGMIWRVPSRGNIRVVLQDTHLMQRL